jgi:serine/threonine protein kinase
MSAESAQPLGNVVEVRVLSGVRNGEQFWFFDSEKVKIGRNPANDVVLPDGGVSRFHAELHAAVDRGGYALCDLGSMAGTFLINSGLAQRVNADTPPLLAGPGAYELCFGRGGPRCRVGLGVSVPFGRYRLIGRLGGGGMAEVYLARQSGLGGFNRPVALKLIQPEMFDLVDATNMFLDEARIAAEINNHNVVKIYDIGEQDGVLFLAMEYLRGVTLSHMSAQLHQRGERMPPDLIAALLSQACAGLHAAHSLRDPSGRPLNVVHRDVSPSNLMCTSEGVLKVIDFGVARADTRLVRKEEGLQGKPGYMSPEQIQGQPLDGRSDIFAIGVVLYELCSDQPLFQRDDTVATFYAVVRGEVPPLRSLCPQASPLLEMIAHKALAKHPDQRFQSAADLAAELDQVVQEAGGRFANISAISRFLTEWGINLSGVPPVLLTQMPKPLLLRRTQAPAGPGTMTPTPLSVPHSPSLGQPAQLAQTLEPLLALPRPPAPPKIAPPPVPPVRPPLFTPAPIRPPPVAPPSLPPSLPQPSPVAPPSPPAKVSAAPGGLMRVAPPPAGTEQRVRTPTDRDLRLYTVALQTPRQHLTIPLPISEVPALLPAPIAIVVNGTTIMVELSGTQIGRGRDRPSIYRDALDPNTRCESHTLLPSTAGDCFDVGHRRATVQRVFYASTLGSPGATEPLRLPMSELHIEVDGGKPLARLCVLYTTDSASGLTHVVCVLIGS